MYNQPFTSSYLLFVFINKIITLLIILLLAPVYLILALLVRYFLGSPVIFKQQRPGLNTKLFVLYKFRTMNNNKDSNDNLLNDNLRLSKFGLFLRSTSLDELPSLFNILKNDINFIGPRPLLTQYLPLYNKEQNKRHNVKPGLTGWAQVNGRNAINWQQKFKLDVWYVDNRSFWLDVKILLLTIKKVFIREGISASNNITMPPFTGNK